MKILFDIDQLPSTSSTCKSKEERFAELEKKVCEIDEKFAKVLARKGGNTAPFAIRSDDEMSDEDKALADIETENVEAKSMRGSDIADGVEENHVDASEPECSPTTPKTRAERIAELECKLAVVSEKFDKLVASLGVEEVCNDKTDDESSALTEEPTAELVSDSAAEPAQVATVETATEPIEAPSTETAVDMTEEQAAEPSAEVKRVATEDVTNESK